MKRTKNMTYKPTDESRELFLYAVNNSRLYPQVLAYIESLKRKYNKGIYSSNKAIDLYYKLATAASESYYKDFGYRFTVQDRFTAAADMEEYFKEDIEEV